MSDTTDAEQLAAAKIVVDDTIRLARKHGWQDGVMLHWLDEKLAENERLRASLEANKHASKDYVEACEEIRRLRASLVEATRDSKRLDWLDGEMERHRDKETGEAFYQQIEMLGWAVNLRALIDSHAASLHTDTEDTP